MATDMYWIKGPWPGKLALAARPRGGDWLDDDIAGWHRNGVEAVMSLLTPEEEESLDLNREDVVVRRCGMDFLRLPIPDRQVPGSETEMTAALESLNAKLSAGRNILIHCRQGIGRTGLVAACLLVSNGVDPKIAVENITAVRGIDVPETTEQRQWIDHYAAALASPKMNSSSVGQRR